MRITAHRMLTLAQASTSRAQSEVARSTAEISSGKRVAVASDDPVAWAQARRAEVRAAVERGRGDAVATGRETLRDTEQALATMADALIEARTLGLAGINGGLTAADLATYADGVRDWFSVALVASNTRNSSGEYVLAGTQTATPPFDADGVYQGDGGVRTIELGEGGSGEIAVTGDELLATFGNVMPAMERLADALNANDVPAMQAALAELQEGIDVVVQARSSVGMMMVSLDESDEARADLDITLAERVSGLIETDIAAAATELAQGTVALEAAQAVTARLAQLLAPSG